MRFQQQHNLHGIYLHLHPIKYPPPPLLLDPKTLSSLPGNTPPPLLPIAVGTAAVRPRDDGGARPKPTGDAIVSAGVPHLRRCIMWSLGGKTGGAPSKTSVETATTASAPGRGRCGKLMGLQPFVISTSIHHAAAPWGGNFGGRGPARTAASDKCWRHISAVCGVR